jgi:hypothetical protein
VLADIAAGARLFARLPAFLRHPLRLDEAEAIVARRLERREADFLALARSTIYPWPTNPYRRLLAHAGCEFGDLERLVSQDGVEGALRRLYRDGVYLSLEEYKGRQPVVRGSVSLGTAGPHALRNPGAADHVRVGSTGRGAQRSSIPIDLAFIRDHGADEWVVTRARGATGWRHAVWNVPGGVALYQLLGLGAIGAPPERWFAQIDPAAPGLHPRYRWGARATRWASVLAGIPLPGAEHVSVESPLAIARWMTAVRDAGGTPHVRTLASSAVRLAQACADAGIRLDGGQFTISGEPVTEARLTAIRATGAEAVARYGSSDAGNLAYGCLSPRVPDDAHVLSDLHALIQAEAEDGPLPPRALLLSSLRPTAPLILLNVSLGDQATLERRGCGCPLERVWPWHVSAIRSYAKLTAAGMMFLDRDVVRVLEETLPARLGGAPTDYQLIEEETADGRPRLRLLVHPRIGPLDPAAAKAVFLEAIGGGSGVERLMELVWQDARVLEIERQAPRLGASGKILHLLRDR